jgi:hypothetical protein
VVSLLLAAGLAAGGPRAAAASRDPLCTGDYAGARPSAGAPLRFGIDPGIAGSAGTVQQPAVADDRRRDLAALVRLRAPGRALVLRLGRLFWSSGDAGVERFRRAASRYTRAGFDVEIQVRYHPAPGDNGESRGVAALRPARG